MHLPCLLSTRSPSSLKHFLLLHGNPAWCNCCPVTGCAAYNQAAGNAGFEARGFIFGPPIAMALGAGFVCLRKPGKLPGQLKELHAPCCIAWFAVYGRSAVLGSLWFVAPKQWRSCPHCLHPGVVSEGFGTIVALTLASRNGAHSTKLAQPSAPQPDLLLGITEAAHGMLYRKDHWGQSPVGPCCWLSFTQLCTFLAGKTIGADYQLEYGVDRIEMHEGHVQPGNKVLLIDDLIATGGTMAAGIKLMKQVDANIVEAACVIEMPDLKGRDKLDASKVPLFVLVEKEGA